MIKVHIKPNVKILKSIPEYKKGWDITAYPDGTITGTPGYLFYEAIVQIKTPENGWCVSSSEIIPFFKSTLKNYGFKNNEIADFLDYWQNHLPRSKFYAIHPVINGDLDLICPLNIKPAPDHILRAWFIFRPLSAKISLNEPHIPPFKRDGFVVTEWGGIIKE